MMRDLSDPEHKFATICALWGRGSEDAVIVSAALAHELMREARGARDAAHLALSSGLANERLCSS
jgi:hypothetical protein